MALIAETLKDQRKKEINYNDLFELALEENIISRESVLN